MDMNHNSHAASTMNPRIIVRRHEVFVWEVFWCGLGPQTQLEFSGKQRAATVAPRMDRLFIPLDVGVICDCEGQKTQVEKKKTVKYIFGEALIFSLYCTINVVKNSKRFFLRETFISVN